MSVKIRLMRAGAKHKPFYRVVVTDSRSPRDGRFIEMIGYYDPLPDRELVKIDEARAKMWIDRGATPSETVKSLLKRASSGMTVEQIAETAKARRSTAIEEANKLAPPPKPKLDQKLRAKATPKQKPAAAIGAQPSGAKPASGGETEKPDAPKPGAGEKS